MNIRPDTAILLPLLCMIGLTFSVMIMMYRGRVQYMRKNRINPQQLQTRDGIRQALTVVSQPADHFNNLLELPLLFYLAILLIWLLHLTDGAYLLLAWGFVLSRLIHSFIHLTYNRVMHRFVAYVIGAVLLFSIWLRLAWHIVG